MGHRVDPEHLAGGDRKGQVVGGGHRDEAATGSLEFEETVHSPRLPMHGPRIELCEPGIGE